MGDDDDLGNGSSGNESARDETWSSGDGSSGNETTDPGSDYQEVGLDEVLRLF